VTISAKSHLTTTLFTALIDKILAYCGKYFRGYSTIDSGKCKEIDWYGTYPRNNHKLMETNKTMIFKPSISKQTG